MQMLSDHSVCFYLTFNSLRIAVYLRIVKLFIVMCLFDHVLLAESSCLIYGASARIRAPAHHVCVLSPSGLVLGSKSHLGKDSN